MNTTDTLKDAVERIEDETQQPVTDQEDFILEDQSIISDEYFEKTCEELSTMNFVEIKKILNEFKFNKDSLEKAKVNVDQIMELKKQTEKSAENDSNLASAIMDANAEMSAGTDNIESFLNSYDDTISKLDALIEKAEERVHEFDNDDKTTSYLNRNMIEIIDKNIERLSKDTSGHMKNLLIYYKEIREIFNNRSSVDFLLERIGTKNIEVRRLKQSLKKDTHGAVLTATQKKVSGLFMGAFKAEQMATVEKYLHELFGNEEIAFYFQYVLSLIYEREKLHGKYGKHKWVEVLFMNIVDIVVECYDLEGGKEFYDEQLLKLKDELVKIL